MESTFSASFPVIIKTNEALDYYGLRNSTGMGNLDAFPAVILLEDTSEILK
jgi:hypothetical protein